MTVEQSPVEHYFHQDKQVKPQETPKQAGSSASVIDLTSEVSDKEDDLQKAIALSLQDQKGVLGGQISMEEQDISRVLEASLAETKVAGTKRKRGELWQDPANPHDRKRNGNWPVGLKNVGNTCWFSAVIQSLFHLPVFRRLVLHFSPKIDWESDTQNTVDRRNLEFMRELRKLFGLMVASKRKYVDPSEALDVLREAFPNSSSTDSQQDASEFTHKLLDWLEDAFKLDSSLHLDSCQENASPTDQNSSHCQNPMLNLFYGHYRSEGLNEGHTFENEEAFGQYPLQVTGFCDIHDSLEAAMAQEIESCYGDSVTNSGQETWFTQLPPVLLFELSRFQFNQQLGRPEKIHHKLEFPELIYMDRYMEYNKNIIRSKREEVWKLKEERQKLQKNLEKYLNYGSGPKRVPLQDVLQYTLEFVESKSDNFHHTAEDVVMTSPSSASSIIGDSPSTSPTKNDATWNSSTGQSKLDQAFQSGLSPTPRHVSDVELSVLQQCLKRWRTEVENDVRELQQKIDRIDKVIREIYNESSLKQVPYRLHAVLVHEGQAASGHYWAYIFCPERRMWLKYNDVTVSEASWAELVKDSVGGLHHASAYCLLYVDSKREELFTDKEKVLSYPNLNILPDDLKRYVEQDNRLFEQEIEKWDTEQTWKKDVTTMTVASGQYGDDVLLEEKSIGKNIGSKIVQGHIEHNSLQAEHAYQVHKATIAKVQQVAGTISTKGPEAGLDEAVQLELFRLQRLVKLDGSQTEDPRLQHIGVYMLLNGADLDPFIHLVLLEQFSERELESDARGSQLRKVAINVLRKLKSNLMEGQDKTYQTWHRDYSNFRKLVTLFVSGVERFHNERYQEALPYLTNACNLNEKLAGKKLDKNRGLEQRLLAYYRRQCLLNLNKVAASQFGSDDLKVASDALVLLNDCLVPSMAFLTMDSSYQEDKAAAEEIRGFWCSKLGEDIQDEKQQQLQDFLGKLLDPSDEQSLRATAPIPRLHDLEAEFHSAMKLAVERGHLETALRGK